MGPFEVGQWNFTLANVNAFPVADKYLQKSIHEKWPEILSGMAVGLSIHGV